MKKIQKLFALIFVLLFISSCTSPASSTVFDVDGKWHATFKVTESTMDGLKPGDEQSGDVVLETQGDEFFISNENVHYSGTRNGNYISVSREKGGITYSIKGSFTSPTMFSGTGSFNGPNGVGKSTVKMTKK